jgi:hypothetical protein
MGERLKVVASNDLALDTGLWEETGGAPKNRTFDPFTPMTVVRPGTVDADDRSPIVEGEARSWTLP